jgi:hypothetical protein
METMTASVFDPGLGPPPAPPHAAAGTPGDGSEQQVLAPVREARPVPG